MPTGDFPTYAYSMSCHYDNAPQLDYAVVCSDSNQYAPSYLMHGLTTEEMIENERLWLEANFPPDHELHVTLCFTPVKPVPYIVLNYQISPEYVDFTVPPAPGGLDSVCAWNDGFAQDEQQPDYLAITRSVAGSF